MAGGVTGSGGSSSGGTGTGGLGGCSSDSDCSYPLLCLSCADGSDQCPVGASCVAGECVTQYNHECALATGGSSGSGGSGGTVGGTGGAYFNVTIEFSVAGAGSFCQHGCTGPSVSISDIGGRSLDHGNWCQIDCSTCSETFCPPVPCPPDAAVTTISRGWDGVYYTPSTCGAGTSCVAANMASSGTYVATACASPGTMTVLADGSSECVVTGPDVCSSLQFKFPSNDTFRGTIGM